MPPDRPRLLALLGALSLACGGVLSAAPPPDHPGSAPASSHQPLPRSSLHGSSLQAPAPSTSSSAGAPGLGLSWRGAPLRLRAARLRVDLGARRATLEGQVELQRDGATLRCRRLELRFDGRGQVEWARGEGDVVVDSAELHAEATEATFDLEQSRVLLRGPVRARRGGVELTASEGTVDLFGQQLELSEVEASVRPAASGR
ncbi:MAG: hypothetical protein MUF64_17000 [Polyangiaceae bacterium]|nr:hypothetical protein [Polyangiaceae bacterium]